MKCCCFKHHNRLNDLVKKLCWCDISLVKISVMAFTLMLVVLWPPIASLRWQWYAVIFVLTAIKPIVKILKK